MSTLPSLAALATRVVPSGQAMATTSLILALPKEGSPNAGPCWLKGALRVVGCRGSQSWTPHSPYSRKAPAITVRPPNGTGASRS